MSVVWLTHSRVAHRKLLETVASTRVRAEQGDTSAQEKIGSMYYYGLGVPQDYGEAIQWYRKSGSQGYAKAQFNLGNMYYRGQGLPQDYSEALRRIQKAANQGDAKGQDALGYMYYNGQAMPQDYTEAARWYRKAAEQGEALAEQGLAYMYVKGQGVQQDDTQAAAWYQKAAEQGDAAAPESLAYMYVTGSGVPKDQREALIWYREAAARGNPGAKRALERLSRPPLRTRRFEMSMAVLWLCGGLWLSLRRRQFGDWKPALITLSGLILMANGAMSLYAFGHDLRYSPYIEAFHIVRAISSAIAILTLAALLLLPKKTTKQLV